MTAYIIVGAIATWVLGWLWYQYLFPKVREEFGVPPSTRTFVITAVALLVLSAAVGTFIKNRSVVDMADTLRLGFKIWVGFLLPVLVTFWASTRQSLNILVATAGYWLVAALLLAILADWMLL
ncbi:MAG: hypothetical protein G01um101438_387 [Parcubacteria group bacterium Gr01-1014_38]|nr:MAG: hypothetical protein G01um101438_387 [Parcubacteria group bacterium Gr01-1014_38]